jgi:hypothetical protein
MAKRAGARRLARVAKPGAAAKSAAAATTAPVATGPGGSGADARTAEGWMTERMADQTEERMADEMIAEGPGAVPAAGGADREGAAAAVEQRMVDFAEDLGAILGTAEKKASEWLSQRQAVTEQLTKIRDTANELLLRLTGAGANVAAAVERGRRRGRPAGTAKAAAASGPTPARRGPGRPKGSAKKASAKKGSARRKRRGMSDEGRARIAAAQKERWARIRAEKG